MRHTDFVLPAISSSLGFVLRERFSHNVDVDIFDAHNTLPIPLRALLQNHLATLQFTFRNISALASTFPNISRYIKCSYMHTIVLNHIKHETQ